jgi:hypothetical protein
VKNTAFEVKLWIGVVRGTGICTPVSHCCVAFRSSVAFQFGHFYVLF